MEAFSRMVKASIDHSLFSDFTVGTRGESKFIIRICCLRMIRWFFAGFLGIKFKPLVIC
jgi:hypothetical protein